MHTSGADAAERDALLRAYQLGHPGVPIIDPLDRVRLLRDRKTMLSSLSNGITILVRCLLRPDVAALDCSLLL